MLSFNRNLTQLLYNVELITTQEKTKRWKGIKIYVCICLFSSKYTKKKVLESWIFFTFTFDDFTHYTVWFVLKALTIFGKFRFECDRNFMVTQSQELIHRMFTDLHTIDCHSILVTKEPFLEFLHLASKPGKFSSPMHKS